MWIYWKDMQPKVEAKPLIDNTDELIEKVQQRIEELEEKVSAIITKLRKMRFWDE